MPTHFFRALIVLGTLVTPACRTTAPTPREHPAPRTTNNETDTRRLVGVWYETEVVVMPDGRKLEGRSNPEYFGPRGIWMARPDSAPYLTFQGWWNAERADDNRVTVTLATSEDCPIPRVRTFQFDGADDPHEDGPTDDDRRFVIVRTNYHVADEVIATWTIRSYRGRGGSDLVPPGGGGGGNGPSGPAGCCTHTPPHANNSCQRLAK